MSAQLRPIATIAFASALLAFGVPANIALAVDCLRKAKDESEDGWMYATIAQAWVKLADGIDTDDASPGDHEGGPDAEAKVPDFH